MFISREFSITEEEYQQIKEWNESHECKLKPKHGMNKYCGPIGGNLTLSFTPTSIGTFQKVKCCCGAELDLNDNI